METAVRTRSVYLVEDSAPIRALVAEMLGRLPDVQVAGEAAAVADAIAGIRATRPDAVVLDLHLKGGNGMEVLRAIHAEAPQIVFIVLTNHPTPQHRRLCLEAGARHFLDKSNEFTRVNEIVDALPGAAL
jgi:DNA-binding NarL/FixJ family response regulator